MASKFLILSCKIYDIKSAATPGVDRKLAGREIPK